MGKGYVAIKEKARRNQEVAAVRGDYFPGRPDMSSTWNATEKSWRKRVWKEERLIKREAEMENMQDFINACAARDVKRGYVARRLPAKVKANA
jgi:hypothetical protein